MLEKMFAVIQSGGTFEVQKLAIQLGTTPGLVLMMLRQLEQKGKLKANSNCENGCGQCGLKSSCKMVGSEKQDTHTWVLVDASK